MQFKLRPLLDGSEFSLYALVLDGRCKTEEFLVEVQRDDPDCFASVMALLQRCADHGPPKNEQKSRHVGAGIFEAKAKHARVCFFYDQGNLIICTHGFNKPAKKVQNAAIKAAQQVKADYFKERAKRTIEIEDI